MTRPRPPMPEDDLGWLRRYRRVLLVVIFAVALGGPTWHLLSNPLGARGWFQLVALVLFLALAGWRLSGAIRCGERTSWLWLLMILALGVALFVVGGKNGDWVPVLAIAAAVCGRYSRSVIPAIVSSIACTAAAVFVSIHYHYSSGSAFSVIIIGPLTAFFAYSAGRRADILDSLRRTRAELARAAVAEERLRIARDVHDLLGHSLSLITLKAELAGRVISSDPDRATREITELESVARQSLSDVREAVAGFRQPDLAGELAAARQLLDAAGISSQISAADTNGLAQDVDSALAWAIREGTTNVVRHSRATHVAITVRRGQGAAVAEISDNGPAATVESDSEPADARVATVGPDGRASLSRVRPAFTGSGLAGLAERVRSLGGEIAAGSVEPRGFRLRVVVPLSPQA